MINHMNLVIPEQENSPAFWKVCNVPIAARLSISGAKAGITHINVKVNEQHISRMKRILMKNKFLRQVNFSWNEKPFEYAINATANAVVAPQAIADLSRSSMAVRIPETEISIGDNPKDLWAETPPDRYYSIQVNNKADLKKAHELVFC